MLLKIYSRNQKLFPKIKVVETSTESIRLSIFYEFDL